MSSWGDRPPPQDRSPWSNDPRLRCDPRKGVSPPQAAPPPPIPPPLPPHLPPPPLPCGLPPPPLPPTAVPPPLLVPPTIPTTTCSPVSDFIEIDEVEWAQDAPENLSGELKTRPKYVRGDPCGCYSSSSSSSEEPCCTDMSCVLFACQEECGSNCSPYCGNRRIAKRQYKSTQVFDAGVKGRGLKVKEDCSRGDFITEYIGRAIDKKYLDALFRRYKNEQMLYIMALDKDTYLDARKKGSNARYINHSCEPNCIVERWKVKGILRAGVFALRDIAAGEELCFDYKWDRKRGRAPTKCHCLSTLCRGTLEMPRSLEEQEMDRQLVGHWKTPISKMPGTTIVNRCIRILSQEYHEYFTADVCKYDAATQKHLVMYTQDREESWEDLTKEDWMILDEEAEKFVISRKTKSALSLPSSLVVGMPSMLLAQQQQLQGIRNYLFVQTPVKQHMVTGRLIDRCQMNCRVEIKITQCLATTPPPADAEEAAELAKALEASKDGCVWKLTLSGPNLVKAYTILEKNVLKLQPSEPDQQEEKQCETQEVILPRCIVDVVKRRIPLIRDKCRSVQVNFAHSESKSKQFARLVLEATLVSDLHTAMDALWKQLVGICHEVGAPQSPQPGIYQDLGFLGGELSSEQFKLLYDNSKLGLRQVCHENLGESPFFASFESTQRCTVWVQTQDDKGRIDKNNLQSVAEADPSAPRKIYFGCDPKDIPKLWGLVQTRASELSRGVKYLFLGSDKMYQQVMMRQGNRFFDYVKKVTGASVAVDSMTGNHLRIDGGGIQVNGPPENQNNSAALAEEVIRLQIEVYRDHCIRQQNWVFGRDWSLTESGNVNSTTLDPAAVKSPRPSSPSSRTQFDSRSVSNACSEIAEIISFLELDGSIAAHAAIILYRFVSKISEKGHTGTQHKIRDLLLACAFLACKAQKTPKWKRLEQMLEAAYQTFYPGAKFDKSSQEAVNCEKRVISAEAEILMTLDYDVFWRGADWILTDATNAGLVSEPLAKNALELTFSGPVLGAGATLWLKYGPDYVFAAAAGFLSIPLDHLFSALSLIPLKVSQAAKLIADAIKGSSFPKRTSSSELFNGGKETLLNMLPNIESVCMKKMSQGVATDSALKISGLSDTTKRFHIIGQRDQSRSAFRAVDPTVLTECIMPIIDGVAAESQCRIFVKESLDGGTADIVLEGSWRARAIAEHLLQTRVSEVKESLDLKGKTESDCAKLISTPLPADISSVREARVNLHGKRQPGLLQMSSISTADGWDKTIQSTVAKQVAPGSKRSGGKFCIPARVPESSLQQAGLRWWIPPRYGPSFTGSICDMVCAQAADDSDDSDRLGPLIKLSEEFMGEATAFELFPCLTAGRRESKGESPAGRFVAVSMQRWPSEKVEAREQLKANRAGRSSMQIGFSPAALQEMQLLTQLHTLIPSPKGHPNFMLPVAVSVPSVSVDRDRTLDRENSPSEGGLDQDIFSLFRTSEDNERVAQKEKKRKDMASGPHLVCEPTPFVLHRLTSRSKRRRGQNGDESTTSPVLLAAWFHDILSALVHCHTNNVVVRFLQPDQIIIDHSGVLKLGGLYKASVIPQEEREKAPNPLKSARSRKDKGDDNNEDISSNLYAAPEMLLGSKKHTKETDVWSVGCLMAHLLLQKPLFIGKDRKSLLLSMFKIVGTPHPENYADASMFPNYVEPPKRYKRGVTKALECLVKEAEAKKHSSMIDLLDRMLHLDPRKRISAVEALSHDFMTEYIENSNSVSFQQEYVKDWTSLKARLVQTNKVEQDEARKQEQSMKRKAKFLMAASTMDEDEDDLYNMDDLLGGTSKFGKKAREGES